jgi:hypothetical protein
MTAPTTCTHVQQNPCRQGASRYDSASRRLCSRSSFLASQGAPFFQGGMAARQARSHGTAENQMTLKSLFYMRRLRLVALAFSLAHQREDLPWQNPQPTGHRNPAKARRPRGVPRSPRNQAPSPGRRPKSVPSREPQTGPGQRPDHNRFQPHLGRLPNPDRPPAPNRGRQDRAQRLPRIGLLPLRQ